MRRLIVIPLALALAACGDDTTTEPLTNDDFAPELNVNLVIPLGLGYGVGGLLPPIPGNATLVFDIELLEVM